MKITDFDCIIVGAGPSGLKAARILKDCGHKVCLLEKEEIPGGKLNIWHELFPHNESAPVILRQLLADLESLILTSVNIRTITRVANNFSVTDQEENEYRAPALLIATGFKPFDARLKEEYGYGIYDNVITSVDLELMFRNNNFSTITGKMPEKVAFIHCVGSRDIKVGSEFCSANCCITGIKQAIELKKIYPSLNITCLYMDLRLGGRLYEYCYKTAQMDYKVQFVRGRLSETNENPDKTIVLRYEDTLAGRPAKITVDLVVLLVGMQPDHSILGLLPDIDSQVGRDGFFGTGKIENSYKSAEDGLFFAGACTSPKSVTQSTDEAADVAFRINNWLNKKLRTETKVLNDRVWIQHS
jgi:heterodisulfide reductase subunit A